MTASTRGCGRATVKTTRSSGVTRRNASRSTNPSEAVLRRRLDVLVSAPRRWMVGAQAYARAIDAEGITRVDALAST
jgi:hypothetical protein